MMIKKDLKMIFLLGGRNYGMSRKFNPIDKASKSDELI
jgi:hypothetical protein